MQSGAAKMATFSASSSAELTFSSKRGKNFSIFCPSSSSVFCISVSLSSGALRFTPVPDPADGDGDIEGAGFLAEADDVDGLMDGCGAGGAVEGGVGPDDFA